jgi:hypothetical protein
MIEKKDYESAVLHLEAMIVNDTINHELANNQFDDKINSYKKQIEFCKKKITEFPEDPMPEGVKELVEAVQ